MFAAFYSTFDVHVVEVGLFNHPKIEKERPFWTYVGIFKTAEDAIREASVWLMDSWSQAELECYLSERL